MPEVNVEALSRQFEGFNTEVQGLAGDVRDVRTELGKVCKDIDAVTNKMAGFIAAGGTSSDNPSRDPRYLAIRDFARDGENGEFSQFLARRNIGIKAENTVGSQPDGGFTVIPDLDRTIHTALRDVSPMRNIASIVNTSSSEYVKLVDASQSTSGWVGEREARPTTGGPNLIELKFPVMEVYAMPAASQSLLDDSVVDIGAWLGNSSATDFAIEEGAAFVAGDGVKKPSGFLSYPVESGDDFTRSTWGSLQYIPTGSATPSTDQLSDALVALSMKLRAPYRGNATWLMSRDMARVVRQLKDGQGRFLWSSDGRMVDGVADRLLGFPVAYDENMPAQGANSLSVALGDFKQSYLIVDRAGIKVLRDPFTNRPYILFYTTKRVGGGVQDFNGIKLLKFAAS